MLKILLMGILLGALAQANDPTEVKEVTPGHGALVDLSKAPVFKPMKLDFPVERVTLENGMVFLLHSQRSIPLVSYHTWFRVGAKDELPGESGLAHMFEHMMFKGSKRFPNKDFDLTLQANGIVNNAFTTQDYTGYYEILPSSKLELMMDMESDRMQSLQLVDSEFQKEREVVKEERRMRYDNDPGGMIYEKLNELVFKGSKYSLPVIGTMAEINGFSVDKLRRFYQKWYVPSNAVVVLVGDFDVSEVKLLINKYYGALKSPPRPVRQRAENSQALKRQNAVIPFPVQAPELMWGSRTVKSGTDDSYALDLLSSILGQGKSSRLYKELVYKQQIALSIGVGHFTFQDSGMFFIQAIAKPGVQDQRLKSEVEKEIANFLRDPIREEELEKAKNIVVSEFVESLKTGDGKARLLALNEILLGDYQEFFRDMDRYLKVSMSDLNRVKKYLALEHTINVTIETPEKRSAPAPLQPSERRQK